MRVGRREREFVLAFRFVRKRESLQNRVAASVDSRIENNKNYSRHSPAPILLLIETVQKRYGPEINHPALTGYQP